MMDKERYILVVRMLDTAAIQPQISYRGLPVMKTVTFFVREVGLIAEKGRTKEGIVMFLGLVDVETSSK